MPTVNSATESDRIVRCEPLESYYQQSFAAAVTSARATKRGADYNKDYCNNNQELKL
jgi:hypothetical protein